MSRTIYKLKLQGKVQFVKATKTNKLKLVERTPDGNVLVRTFDGMGQLADYIKESGAIAHPRW